MARALVILGLARGAGALAARRTLSRRALSARGGGALSARGGGADATLWNSGT